MMATTAAHQRYRSKTKFLKNGKGIIFPGVTTIVGILNKPALVPWANKLGLQGIDVKRFVDDKADIGILAHAMIIDKLMERETDTTQYSKAQIDSAENACLSFYAWQESHRLNVMFGEMPLVSEKYEFGGQFDIVGTVQMNGETTIDLLDLKTGSGIYEEHYYQLGGYWILLEENDIHPQQIRILNIPRSEDENFQEVTMSGRMIELAKEMFLDCLSIYKRKKEVNRLMKR
jgi:hypothetical protein